jgi:hypothetical protein
MAIPETTVTIRAKAPPGFCAGLAQLVEHLICNQGVGGSNPSAGTSKIKQLPRTKGGTERLVWGSVCNSCSGSVLRVELQDGLFR